MAGTGYIDSISANPSGALCDSVVVTIGENAASPTAASPTAAPMLGVTCVDNDQEEDDKVPKKRSKNGCVTCKIRKKRCDEVKPSCGDCIRLKRTCTWITPEMTSEEVRDLKRKVEIVEEDSKTRKRKKKDKKPPSTEANEAMVGVNVVEEVKEETGVVEEVGSPATAKLLSMSNSPFSLSPYLQSFEHYLDDYQHQHPHVVVQASNQIEELELNEEKKLTLYPGLSANGDAVNSLDDVGLKLYDYFRNKLAGLISIVPAEENLYLKTFLPMAHRDPGVLYGILAWSGFHSVYKKEGDEYFQKSVRLLNDSNLDDSNSKDEDYSNSRIANYLILCGAEICRGDVSNWSSLLQKCAKLIKLRGIRSFNDSETRHWLVMNFAYHDIMTSSIMERGISFPLEDYNYVINYNKFGLDPLNGLCRPLFQLIGEISNFAMTFNKLLQLTTETLSDDSYKNRYELLQQMNATAKKIDLEIDQARPDLKELYKLTPKDFELHLTLFEGLQTTAKLHLRQAILNMSPKTSEVQMLCIELMRSVNIVLGSSVQSTLVFPLFILGINLSNANDRSMMMSMFENYNKSYQYGNIERAKEVVQKVWEKNANGEICVDWCEVVKDLGWELSFA